MYHSSSAILTSYVTRFHFVENIDLTHYPSVYIQPACFPETDKNNVHFVAVSSASIIMGGRHLIIIYHNGKYVLVKYVQWDADGQGARILRFLSTPEKPTALKSNLHLLQVAAPDQRKAIVEECMQADREEELRQPHGFLDMYDTTLSLRYPSFDRGTGAEILDVIADAKDDKPIFIPEVEEDLKFAIHFLCYRIYIIDLDANKLEVYKGRVKGYDTEAARSRFVPSLQSRRPREWETLVNTVPQFLVEFDIEKLPGEEEFVSQIKKRLIKVDEDGEEDDVNGRQCNDEEDDTSHEGSEAVAADVHGD